MHRKEIEMRFYDMTLEEQNKGRQMIENIIGSQGDWIKPDMDCSKRIKARASYDKLFDKLAKVYAEHGDKALAMEYTSNGAFKEGTTPNGKKWVLVMNSGWTERSRHCGTLTIEGEGTIFTSGTIAKAFEYILTH